jgi:uncharacterized membrane protein
MTTDNRVQAERRHRRADGEPGVVQKNIAAIAELEREALGQRTLVERIGVAIGNFAGSMRFVVLHFVLVGAWLLLNLPASSPRFDPYPFNTLVMMLAMESILISAFILMAQNQMTKSADRRAHLNLQISLLAETEMTNVLRTLRAITQHLGVLEADDPKFAELIRETDVKHVVQVLAKEMPDSTAAAEIKSGAPGGTNPL